MLRYCILPTALDFFLYFVLASFAKVVKHFWISDVRSDYIYLGLHRAESPESAKVAQRGPRVRVGSAFTFPGRKASGAAFLLYILNRLTTYMDG